MNILIVDDEAMIREWMVYTIRNLPIDMPLLDTATDGIEALEKLSLSSYDLVFVDITMPRMDGIELIKEINALGKSPMIVVLSSHDQFDYARKAFQHNASEYILKNECSKERLMDLIEKCESQLKQKQLSKDLSYYRSAFLASTISGNSETSNIPLDKLFPEIAASKYFIMAYNRNISSTKDLEKISDGMNRIFIGNSSQLSFFAYLSQNNLSIHDIENILSTSTSNKNLQVGSSIQHNTINDLTKAISSAYAANHQLFYTDNNYNILSNISSPDTDMFKINEQCALILRNINSNDLDQARDNLSVLHHIITLAKPDDITNVKNINYNILSAMIMKLSKNTQQVMPNLRNLKAKIEESQRFSDIKSYTDEYFYFLAPLQSPTTDITSEYILEALNFIHNKYASIESISQIANYVHINTDYFSRLFKKEVGVPASTYLMNYKLEIAALALTDTSDTVYEIALHVGYSNISYFSKIFKAKYNLQPSQYRKVTNT